MFNNTQDHYGWLTIIMHWLVAVTVIGMFALGYWMVELDYYDPWYQQGPKLHMSIGVCLFALMLFRLLWNKIQTKPRPLGHNSRFEKVAARVMHSGLYLLLFIIMLSGYLISTADGRDIEVFELFKLTALGELFADQEEIAGIVHQYGAYVLVGAVLLHALGAFKHHFIDKDKTLSRMLGYKQ